jgi:ATP-dependent helicase HrpB
MLMKAPASARGLACDLAALLEERDPWQHRPGRWRPVDLQPRLDALERFRQRQPTADFDMARLRAVQRAAAQFKRLVAEDNDSTIEDQVTHSQQRPIAEQSRERMTDAIQDPPQVGAKSPTSARATHHRLSPTPSLGALLALAYPERIARRRDGREGVKGGVRYLLRNGSGAELPRDDALATEPWLVIADLNVAQGDHRIRAAAAINEADVRADLAEQISHTRTLGWDAQREAVVARDEVRLGAILIDTQPAPLTATDDGLALLLRAIERDPERAFTWSPAARQFCARVQLARRLQPEAGWPDFSLAGLKTGLRVALQIGPNVRRALPSQTMKPLLHGIAAERRLDAEPLNDASPVEKQPEARYSEQLGDGDTHWLAPWLAGKRRLAEVRALDLIEILRQHLGWAKAQALDSLAPTRLQTPAETWRPIDYRAAEQPVLQVPLQELFGVSETPCIFDGRQPLLLHLLSPAGRPLQVTQDLAAFWSGAYAEVRKEMRGRYPKHHWPEDPATERPIKGGLKRHAR